MISNRISLKQAVPVVEASVYSALIDLAYETLVRDFVAGTDLVTRLERSIVVPDGQLAHDVVRLGSTVTYDLGGELHRTMTLVYPTELDAAEARISVLAPMGVAVLGLRPGQRGQWYSRGGQSTELTVVDVINGLNADLVY